MCVVHTAPGPDSTEKVMLLSAVGTILPLASTSVARIIATSSPSATTALPVPVPLMEPAAALVERLMADPPITTAQLGLLRRGVLGSLDETRSILGRAPRPYTAEGVQAAVGGLLTLSPDGGRGIAARVRPMLPPGRRETVCLVLSTDCAGLVSLCCLLRTADCSVAAA